MDGADRLQPPSENPAPGDPSADRPNRRISSYSRFVGALKWLLPTAAVALAILVVLWPQLRTDSSKFRIGYAAIGSDEKEISRMMSARFVGVDDRNQAYTLTARSATRSSENANRVELEAPQGDIALNGGAWVSVRADSGLFDDTAKTLELSGAVTLFHDAGYEARTPSAHVELARHRASGTDPIEVQGPSVRLEAQGFEIDQDTSTIRFTGRTRMILRGAPKARG